MFAIEEPDIEQKIQRVGLIKAGFRRTKDRRYAFESILRDHYEHLRTAQTPTQEDVAQSLHALHGALNEPELVEQQLLIDVISEIIRFVENAGLGFAFSKAFMDRAITVYRQAGFSPIDLYLEKASLLRLDQLESVEREQVLMEAKQYAESIHDLDGLVRVLLSCAVYYTEVSQYRKSLQVCQECERLIQGDDRLQKYMARLLVFLGMNYTSWFKYRLAKKYLLQAKTLLEQEQARRSEGQKDDMWVSSVETIHHYLGRIAEAEGNIQEALRYYVDGYQYLDMFEHGRLAREAYYHLRIGELLVSASLLKQARDHLRISREIFDAIQFSSSGRVQVSLAWAALYNREGDYRRAHDSLLAAKEESQNKHFPRGQLLCLVKLFWLELGHFHLYGAILAFVQAMSTWRGGELGRNEGIRLFGQYLMQVLSTPFKLLTRRSHTVMGAGTFNATLSSCLCPIHQADKTN